MAGGRKFSQTTDSGDGQQAGPRGFRRKLSDGLALLSNTRGQRKTSQASRVGSDPSLITSASKKGSDVPASRQIPLQSTPLTKSTAVASLSKTPSRPADDGTSKRADPHTTPRALLRSLTTSFIPRPVRDEPHAPTPIPEHVDNAERASPVIHGGSRALPSKIPTPSPTPSEQRYSPRQYIHHGIPLHSVAESPRVSPATNSNAPRSSFSIRSRTTPNLVNTFTSPQPAVMTRQRNLEAIKNVIPRGTVARPPILQENIPTSRPVAQGTLYSQQRAISRENFPVTPIMDRKRGWGSGDGLGQSTQQSISTPLTARRTNPNLTRQGPATARRLSTQLKAEKAQEVGDARDQVTINQARLTGPQNWPTPAPTSEFATAQTPMASSADNRLPRKSMETSNNVGGFWRPSRSKAAGIHEVSKVPRSSTWHNLGRLREPAPPVPPIPEQYRTTSLANLLPPCFTASGSPQNSGMPPGTVGMSNLSGDTGSKKVDLFPNVTSEQKLPQEPSKTTNVDSSSSSDDLPTKSTQGSGAGVSSTETTRPWSIEDPQYPDNADVDTVLQVQTYMPPIWWAGRFQSRFDQWRTEAMNAQLNPNHQPEGLLGQCKLNDEKRAACYIFAQLRDLCATNEAADSLWEFEYKYRKDHRMLGNPNYPVMTPRKYDDQSNQKGGFGRAVRKLTPRKSSFVNLLKGKGWNKDDNPGGDTAGQSGDVSSSHP